MFNFKCTNPYNAWVKFSSLTDLNGSFAKWAMVFHLAMVEPLLHYGRVLLIKSIQSFWNYTGILKIKY